MSTFDQEQADIGEHMNELELAGAHIGDAWSRARWALDELAERAESGERAHELLRHIAQIYEDNSNEAGEWDNNDIIEQVADALDRGGYFKTCEDHGVYAATSPTCPFDHTDEETDDE